MNGIVHYKFDYGWNCDENPGPKHLGQCYHELKHGTLQAFFIEGVPAYLNPYPFEIGEDRAPLSESAETQIRFAMSIVSNHSERVQIAARCARQTRHIAHEVLHELDEALKEACL